MGVFDRLRSKRPWSMSTRTERVTVLGGRESLEVVGESQYQDTLWRLCRGSVGDMVRHDIVAVLVPEPTNPYDANAVAVQVDNYVVGYLARATAQEYLPGLKRLMSTHGGYIALHGVIVGGGYYDDGPGRLGVWLEHDPTDFGIQAAQLSHPGAEGDTIGLLWLNELPEADRPAIAKLRELLANESDPIARHYQFTELEMRLYRSRDLYDSALDEYDKACVRHDAEMENICDALVVKWGEIPPLDTYRQMAIRQQKKQDYQACKWWAERGLVLYGERAAREVDVEDLVKRRNRAAAKLEATAVPVRQANPEDLIQAGASALAPEGVPRPADSNSEVEILVCQQCGSHFDRTRTRGRKPTLCMSCRTAAKHD